MKISPRQRDQLRAEFESQGMPEIYAFMAAQAAEVYRASNDLWSAFLWAYTDQGNQFWRAIADETYGEQE